jgi:hypothetical protein
MLHQGERRTLTTKSVRETEAEAVAIGLEMGSSASDYIQIWNGDANLLRAAVVILGGIAP